MLFAIIFVFIFTVYATSDKIGSFGAMHALLDKASAEQPVAGNAQGSYITMRSKNGLIFGVINVIGNFATVFQDQAVSSLYILLLRDSYAHSIPLARSTGNARSRAVPRHA